MFVSSISGNHKEPSRSDLYALMQNLYALMQKMLTSQHKTESKVDFIAMNLERVSRYILPGEKYVKRPEGMPNIPLEDMKFWPALENFLADDNNLSALVSYLHSFKCLICNSILSIHMQ